MNKRTDRKYEISPKTSLFRTKIYSISNWNQYRITCQQSTPNRNTNYIKIKTKKEKIIQNQRGKNEERTHD